MKEKLFMSIVLLFLIHFSTTERVQSETWDSLNKVLPRQFHYVQPPPPYEAYVWSSGCDFAHIRDVQTPLIKGLNVVAWSTLGAVVGAAAGGTVGASIGLGAGQTLPTGMHYFAESLGNLLTSGAEWSWGNWVWPVRLSEVINRLDSELGISDYYVFGYISPINPMSSGGTLPLGAWVRFDFNVFEHQRRYRTLNAKDVPVVGANPLVFRLSHGELDFEKVDARIFERDLSGTYRPVTINTVFTYEYFQGIKISKGSQDKTHQMLTVLRGHPDPEHGGKIIGKAELKYLPGVGISGLREIHLCSPVNDGLVFKEGDAFAFAITLDANTVTVELISSGDKNPNINEELAIRVFVKGLHKPTASYIDASDKVHYLWKDIATQVFDGAKCEGAGVTDTQIEHDEQFTTFRCTPTEGGDIYAVLQTIDGPVKFKAASVESDSDSKGASRKYYNFYYWVGDKSWDGWSVAPLDAKIPIPGAGDAHFLALQPTYGTETDSIRFGSSIVLRGIVAKNKGFIGRHYTHPDFLTRGTELGARLQPDRKFRLDVPDEDRYSLLTIEGQLSPDFMIASGLIRVVFKYDDGGNPLPPPGTKIEVRWQSKALRVSDYSGFIEE